MDLSSLEERSSGECSHSPLIRCIELPQQCGVQIAEYNCCEATFHLFLRFLYFSSTLHSPPFLPKLEVVQSLTESHPTSFAFPPSLTKEELEKYSRREVDNNCLMVCEPLLSLFNYFDCQAALKRCEAVILSPERARGSKLWGLWWLPIAERHTLKLVEQKCIEAAVAQDKQFRADDAQIKALLTMLRPETVIRLLEASIRR